MSTEQHHTLAQFQKQHQSLSTQVKLLPLLGLALPFTPLPVALAVGVALGAYSMSLTSKANKHTQHRNPGKRYFPRPPNDADVIQQILLCYAMDFSDFTSGEEEYFARKGILKPTPDDKREYLDYVLPQTYPLFLSDDLLTRHVSVTGATGVGKTELYLSVLEMNTARGGGTILFDAKGSKELISRVNYIAKKYHREDDVIFINFSEPELSHTYNPVLHGGNVRETVSTTMKVNSKTREEFFRDQNRAALVAAMVCLQAQPGKPAFHFGDLGILFNDPYEFHRLFENIPREDREAREFVWQFLHGWLTTERETGQPIYNVDRYQTILKGLASKMFDFAHTDYRKVLCTYEPDLELKSAIMENKIIVVSLPALADKEGVELFGKLFLADFARAIGQLESEGTKPLVPYIVLLDEYGSFKDPSHQELFQLARSANISLWLSVQSRGFLEDEDPVFAANLLSNCWTQVMLFVKDPDSQEKAAKIAGSTIRNFKQESTSEGFGYGHSNAEAGSVRAENSSRTRSTGFKAVREDLLLPEHFDMDEGDCIVIGKNGVFRGRLPMVQFDRRPPPLEEVYRLTRFSKTKSNGLHLMEKALRNDTTLIDQLSARARED